MTTAATGLAFAIAAPATANAPSSHSPATAKAAGSIHVYPLTGFNGPGAWLQGNVNQCTYVGDDWNDKVRSARLEREGQVELWENYNCTGYSITVDRTGYNSIGTWVSAFRPR
ncbi:peptidase inhibitor family I36 protein [Pilimelia terevasa]|uniref:peptidase inhibitor family I36 protein n=1 Tax=Pilimelia terevasa TaxID=53372 RepID=UPI001663E098|nr:peptidase inhibitor family I36 protein [Pilimelia terevasa]